MTFSGENERTQIEINNDCWAECDEPELTRRRNEFARTAARILGEQLSAEQTRETLIKSNSHRLNEGTHGAEFDTLRFNQCVPGNEES